MSVVRKQKTALFIAHNALKLLKVWSKNLQTCTAVNDWHSHAVWHYTNLAILIIYVINLTVNLSLINAANTCSVKLWDPRRVGNHSKNIRQNHSTRVFSDSRRSIVRLSSSNDNSHYYLLLNNSNTLIFHFFW